MHKGCTHERIPRAYALSLERIYIYIYELIYTYVHCTIYTLRMYTANLLLQNIRSLSLALLISSFPQAFSHFFSSFFLARMSSFFFSNVLYPRLVLWRIHLVMFYYSAFFSPTPGDIFLRLECVFEMFREKLYKKPLDLCAHQLVEHHPLYVDKNKTAY